MDTIGNDISSFIPRGGSWYAYLAANHQEFYTSDLSNYNVGWHCSIRLFPCVGSIGGHLSASQGFGYGWCDRFRLNLENLGSMLESLEVKLNSTQASVLSISLYLSIFWYFHHRNREFCLPGNGWWTPSHVRVDRLEQLAWQNAAPHCRFCLQQLQGGENVTSILSRLYPGFGSPPWQCSWG